MLCIIKKLLYESNCNVHYALNKLMDFILVHKGKVTQAMMFDIMEAWWMLMLEITQLGHQVIVLAVRWSKSSLISYKITKKKKKN